MCQEKEEEVLTALKTVLTHNYNDLKTILKKTRRKTDYSHQTKQKRQHEDQQNGIKQKTKMGRKTTPWKF